MNEDQELVALEELEAELKALEEFVKETPAEPAPEAVIETPKPKPAKAKAPKKATPKQVEPVAKSQPRLYGADKLRAKRGR